MGNMQSSLSIYIYIYISPFLSTDSSKYWAEAASDSPTTEPRHYGHYSHPSFEVEQTAYGLLANLYDGRPIGEVIPILSWLTKQQNSQGGFRSTQVRQRRVGDRW